MTLTAEERNETRVLTSQHLNDPPEGRGGGRCVSVRRASGLIGEVAACGAAIVPYSLSVRPINQRPPLVTMQPCRERENAVKFRRLYEDMTVFMGKKTFGLLPSKQHATLWADFEL